MKYRTCRLHRYHHFFYFVVAGLVVLCGHNSHALLQDPSVSVTETVTVDGNSAGRFFDGVGAISSSSSRLLYDYPEPQRSQILDYLFKPNFGASLQILKVEIGGDTNSTVTSEPSHMRTPQEHNCGRGIEWWMMREAQHRNPNIRFYGLLWGAPGWLQGGLWSADHVRYVLSWLGCAQENGFHIDYIGGANESYQPPPEPSFFIALHKALESKFPSVKIVGTDEHVPPEYWKVATVMKRDTKYRDAIDILGEHDVCHWRTTYQHCDVSPDALASGKPLWNSEQSSQDATAGDEPLARAMNRNYIDARITANINWAMIAAFYGNTDTGGTGLMLAETPWSGRFEVNKSVWVDAHTTQFVQPGWRYLDSASGYLKGGGSYVSLKSPTGNDYTIIIETTDSTAPETVRFLVSGLSTRPLHLWVTDLSSERSQDWFVNKGVQKSDDGTTTITLQPHHLYTLSTTTCQHKGDALLTREPVKHLKESQSRTLSLPYREDFEHVDPTLFASYFQDLAGSFETQPCAAGRKGNCYEQVISQPPILWHDGGKVPATLMGDPEWWGDYEVSVEIMLPETGSAELLGRVEKYNPDVLSGYHLQLASSGKWKLYSQDVAGKNTELSLGTLPFRTSKWHRISLRFESVRVVATCDGKIFADLTDAHHRTGQIGFAVRSWEQAQFDNLIIKKTKEWPLFLSHSHMRATATSAQPGVYQHHVYLANRAIDGRPESRWISQFDPVLPLPQAITLDLGGRHKIYGLTYQPPLDMRRKATITEYRIAVSLDGRHFRKVSQGKWNDDIATKIVAFPGVTARYVRLEGVASDGSGAGAAEINVALSRLQ